MKYSMTALSTVKTYNLRTVRNQNLNNQYSFFGLCNIATDPQHVF